MNEITHLSFSRLKALSHSPLCLKRYIEQTRTSTKAMDEGTLFDCLLFEKDTFKDRFFIMPEGVKKPTSSQINAKKPAPETLEQIKKWESIQAQIGNKIIITQDQYDDSVRFIILEMISIYHFIFLVVKNRAARGLPCETIINYFLLLYLNSYMQTSLKNKLCLIPILQRCNHLLLMFLQLI